MRWFSRFLLLLFLLCRPLAAQEVGPTGGGSGGSGEGVASVSTTCPTTGPSTGAVTISSGIGTTTRSPVSGATDTILAGDCGELTVYTATTTITVPQAGSAGFPAGWTTNIILGPSASLTLSTTTSVFSNTGTSTTTVAGPGAFTLNSNATNWNVAIAISGMTGPNSSVSGNLPSFNGTSGKTLQDSGIPASEITPPPVPAAVNKTQIYPLWGKVGTVGTSNVAPAQNTARCVPFFVNMPQHWDELQLSVSTLGTGPINVALYTDAIDATTGVHQPQTNLSTGTFTVTGTGIQTSALGVAGTGIAIPAGLNHACTNDTTSSDAVRFVALPTTSPLIFDLVGVVQTTAFSGTMVTGFTAAETAGTWPSFAGVAFTPSTTFLSPFLAARVVSVP